MNALCSRPKPQPSQSSRRHLTRPFDSQAPSYRPRSPRPRTEAQARDPHFHNDISGIAPRQPSQNTPSASSRVSQSKRVRFCMNPLLYVPDGQDGCSCTSCSRRSVEIEEGSALTQPGPTKLEQPSESSQSTGLITIKTETAARPSVNTSGEVICRGRLPAYQDLDVACLTP